MIQRIIDAEVFQIGEAKWRIVLDHIWADGSSFREAVKNFQSEFPDEKFIFRFHLLNKFEEVF